MQVWLLTIEIILVVLVGLALWFCLAGRLVLHWVYLLLGILPLSILGAGFARYAAFVYILAGRKPPSYFAVLLLLGISTLVVGIWLLSRGARPRNGRLAAARWPVRYLLVAWIALSALLALHLYRVDHNARARASALRTQVDNDYAALTGPMPPEGDNARDLYLRAFSEIRETMGAYDRELAETARPGVESPGAWDVLEQGEQAENAQVVELLSRLEPALELLRQAADRPECRFEAPAARSRVLESGDRPHLRDFRGADEVLGVHARQLARQGRFNDAIAELQVIRGMATHVDQTEPWLTPGLVQMAMNAALCRALVDILPCATQSSDLPRDLLPDGPAASGSFERNLRGEELDTLAMLLDLSAGHLQDRNLSATWARTYRAIWLESDVSAVRARYQQYRTAVRDDRGAPVAIGDISSGSSLVQLLLLRDDRKFLDARLRLIANIRQARIALALTRYRIEHGAYPPTLRPLVPALLPEIPADPFDGKPMRYRLDGADAIIYSVGVDGKDDGGRITYDPGSNRLDSGVCLRAGQR